MVTGEDYEWDVEYDFSTFSWASGHHASQEEAIVSWHGANPGAHTVDMEGDYDDMFQE